jgi:hypothetical protein
MKVPHHKPDAMLLTLRTHEICFIKELRDSVYSGYNPLFLVLSRCMKCLLNTAFFCQINPAPTAKCEQVRR